MKKKFDFGICGAFDFEEKTTGGQSVKTREFYLALKDKIPENRIRILESTMCRKNPTSFFIQILRMMFSCSQVIIFPAQNGIRVLAPLLVLLRRATHTKIHYSVIGGWLPCLAEQNKKLRKALLQFDCIFVETNFMKTELEKMGFSNVYQLENFKRLQAVREEEVCEVGNPVKLCFFSRVIKEKGIEDAVKVVKRVNRERGKKVCVLDIYGPVIASYQEEFIALQNTFSDEIRYCGKIHPSESIYTLKKYDIQVFPTQYATEGIPGSIVDSYFAGVPVLASRWNSFHDVIEEGITGIGFVLGDPEDFYEKLCGMLQDTDKLEAMKFNCLLASRKYAPEAGIEKMLQIVNR